MIAGREDEIGTTFFSDSGRVLIVPMACDD